MVASSKEKPARHAHLHDGGHVIAAQETKARAAAVVVRDVLNSQRFSHPADLRDVVEDRCRALGLACTRPIFERALELVGSNTILLAGMGTPAPRKEPPAVIAAPSRDEAKRLLDRFGVDLSGGRLRQKPEPSASDAPKHFPRLMGA